jgi:hypothetical protein
MFPTDYAVIQHGSTRFYCQKVSRLYSQLDDLWNELSFVSSNTESTAEISPWRKEQEVEG